MKVLLVYPDFLATREKQGSEEIDIEKGGWYAEGLASISAVLKKAGHEVALMHLTAPASRKDFERVIKKEKPQVVGFTVRTSAFPYVRDYVKWVKEIDSSLLTILGGVHATIAPKDTIEVEGVDVVCVGEGEEPLVGLCSALDKGEDITNIPNLLVKKGKRVIVNPPRKLIHPLDDLPLPDFELFNVSKLIPSKTKTAVVIVSRGCPYTCGYCCNHKIRAAYPDPEHYTRFRSPANAVAYVKQVLELYPWITYIRFIDNILGIQKEWLEEFCRLYKKEINLPFACDHRADLATPEFLRILKDAGCDFIYFGVETGDERLRADVLSRYMTNEQIKTTFAECRKLGIRTMAFNILGLPYETPEKALKTIKLNAEIHADRMIPNIFTPYPYTTTYETSLKEGFIPGPMVDYRDEVFLEQPDFSKEEVLFLAMYFRFLVRLYRAFAKYPALGRTLDKVILWPHLPRRSLTSIMKAWDGFTGKGKAFIREKTPGVYLFLRDKVLSRS